MSKQTTKLKPQPWDMQASESKNPKLYMYFCIYRDLGVSRSMEKVAHGFDLSISAMMKHSARHNWVNRAALYDAHIEKLSRLRNENKVVALTVKHQGIAENFLTLITEPMQELNERIDTFRAELKGDKVDDKGKPIVGADGVPVKKWDIDRLLNWLTKNQDTIERFIKLERLLHGLATDKSESSHLTTTEVRVNIFEGLSYEQKSAVAQELANASDKYHLKHGPSGKGH